MVKRKKTHNKMAKQKKTDNKMTKRKKTDNKMTKRKRTKMIQNTLHRNINIRQHQPTTKICGELRCSGMVSSSCLISHSCRATLKRHEHHQTLIFFYFSFLVF